MQSMPGRVTPDSVSVPERFSQPVFARDVPESGPILKIRHACLDTGLRLNLCWLAHELFQSHARQVVCHPFIRQHQCVFKGMSRLPSLVQRAL
jgi:hypothetical protein